MQQYPQPRESPKKFDYGPQKRTSAAAQTPQQYQHQIGGEPQKRGNPFQTINQEKLNPSRVCLYVKYQISIAHFRWICTWKCSIWGRGHRRLASPNWHFTFSGSIDQLKLTPKQMFGATKEMEVLAVASDLPSMKIVILRCLSLNSQNKCQIFPRTNFHYCDQFLHRIPHCRRREQFTTQILQNHWFRPIQPTVSTVGTILYQATQRQIRQKRSTILAKSRGQNQKGVSAAISTMTGSMIG